jgi:N12 class adenine-specific DNA methylase
MENLNEGKKKKGKMAYEAALREIDAQSAIVAMEAKIEKLKEMAKSKKEKMEMVQEDENLSELIDKRAMSAMMKEIKQIEKMQEKLERLYEKKNGKKMPEMVDEEMDDKINPGNTEDDQAKKDAYDYDARPAHMKEEELDEAHCNTEEDDTNVKEETNEEVNRWQKLAGL